MLILSEIIYMDNNIYQCLESDYSYGLKIKIPRVINRNTKSADEFSSFVNFLN